jgi:RNA polymerase sigma-70 factor, ECF subfamily
MTDLTEATAPRLLAYFLRRVEVREDAADLVAETLAVAWRRFHDLPDDDTEATMWLFRTASHVLTNHRRTRRRQGLLSRKLRAVLHDEVVEPASAEALDVRAALGRLDPRSAELVRLVNWDGLTLAEAASALGLNASTARSRYAAAKQELRQLLGDPTSAGTRPGSARRS